MNISKAKNIHKAAAKKLGRYAMECVCIKDGKAQATDGRILVSIDLEGGEEGPPILIDRKAWASGTKGKASEEAILERDPDDDSKCTITKGNSTVTCIQGVACDFPRTDQILDGQKGDHVVRLNADYLRNLLTAMGTEHIDLHVKDAHSPVHLIADGVHGVIMPIAQS